LEDAAAVDLELRLARAEPRAEPTALSRQLRAPASESGQPVPQERQLDLGAALLRAGVLGEDVEDDRGAVDRRAG
jgi:hypothetical protein